MKKRLLTQFGIITSTSYDFNNLSEKSYNYVVSTSSSDVECGQIKKIEQIIQKRLL